MKLLSHYFSDHPSRLLLVRTDRIGDVILATPAASALRKHFTNMEVHFLVRTYTKPMVENHPAVAKVWVEENFQTIWQKMRFLRQNRLDGILFLHPEPDWAFAAFLAHVPLRIGTGYRAYSFLFNRRVYEHRKYGNRHEADLNLDLLRPLGITDATVSFNMPVTVKAQKTVTELLEKEGISTPYIVLHPGSGGSAADWSPSRFAHLADLIYQFLAIPVIFTGSSNENELIDFIQKKTAYKHFRLDGQLSLKELAALLQRAEVLVANSTGPLHLAVAVGTEVVGLYYPERSCHPDRWGPYGRKDSVLLPSPAIKCEWCNHYKCEHFNCMELISVKSVFEKVKEKINTVVN